MYFFEIVLRLTESLADIFLLFGPLPLAGCLLGISPRHGTGNLLSISGMFPPQFAFIAIIELWPGSPPQCEFHLNIWFGDQRYLSTPQENGKKGE